ncbi:putative invertase inhibitor [Argentina anserina]|uniref:putative invertase inhibitor n=1 Tax=Argentina anserina TaxID=57926 RepID=UPI0021769425|nr:putative invertase inhibitor [Potentilla anserina]
MRCFFFITLIVLFHNTMGFKDLIRLSCKKAAASDPNLSYKFCVSSLEAVPESHGADLDQLVAITLNLTISNATSISSTISKLLIDKQFDKYAKDCLQDCLELYSDAVPTLQEAVGAFKAKDYSKANTEVSAAMDASSTCEDGFMEKKGEVYPLKLENDNFCQLNVISLAFINTLALDHK